MPQEVAIRSEPLLLAGIETRGIYCQLEKIAVLDLCQGSLTHCLFYLLVQPLVLIQQTLLHQSEAFPPQREVALFELGCGETRRLGGATLVSNHPPGDGLFEPLIELPSLCHRGLLLVLLYRQLP